MCCPATPLSCVCRSRRIIAASRCRSSQGFRATPDDRLVELSPCKVCAISEVFAIMRGTWFPNSSFCCSGASGAEVGWMTTMPWYSAGTLSLVELV